MNFNNPDEAAFAFRRGEEIGLKYFYDKLYAALVFFSFKIVKDKVIAEDITSESFVKIWERREGFKEDIKIKSWMYAVVRNASFDYVRERRKENKLTEDVSWIKQNDVEPSIEECLIKASTLEFMHNSVNKLPPQCNEVIKMIFFEEMSLGEIARIKNLSINTIKNQRARGLAETKKYMNGKVPTPYSVAAKNLPKEPIIELYKSGKTISDIARIYDVAHTTISRIIEPYKIDRGPKIKTVLSMISIGKKKEEIMEAIGVNSNYMNSIYFRLRQGKIALSK